MTYHQLPPIGDKFSSKLRLRYCAQQNLFKHAIQSSFGGLNNSFQCLVNEHQSLGEQSLDTGLILSINAHLWGLIFPLIRYGSTAQQQYWLPGLLAGDIIGGHAITEPQAGSDINALCTKAIATPEGFIVNGHKRFITNTPIADALLIYAQLDNKLSAFIIERTDLGAIFTDTPQVNGCSTATMGDVILQDCFIPSGRLLGKIGAGTMMIQSALELERAFIFAGINGIMQWQLDQVIHYSRERKTHGVHLGSNQAISHKIAEMKLRLDSCILWVNECARMKDGDKRISLVSAQTKLFASEAFLQSSLDSVHIMGSNGLLKNNIISTLVHDALASRLFSGSSEIQKNIIATLVGTGDGFKSR